MAFKLACVTCRFKDYALRQDRIIVSHAGRHVRSHYAVVTVTDDDGRQGYGEAAVTPDWSGETAETAAYVIEKRIAPAVLGNTFDQPREAMALIDHTIVGHPFAKSAVDTAIWDLWARIEGCSVASAIADREIAVSVPSRASVGAYPVAETVRLAQDFLDAGIETLKFKIGVDQHDDVARLRAVRDAVGSDVRFTVDANGAYQTLDEACAAIEALLPFDLALVEQPVPRERLYLMSQIRQRFDVPLMVDEGVFSPLQLAEALDLDAFDILSVYPGKNGGFTHALDMARQAHQAGKQCAIGCNLETDLGQAAMVALAASLSAFPIEDIPCDFPASIFYESSATTPTIPLRDGRVTVPTGNGFGVEPRD